MEQIIRIGMDTSKHVFELHGVNVAEEPVLRRRLRRKQMTEFFEKLPPTVIGIEACAGSHHWARLLGSFGHEVQLIPPPTCQALRQARKERRCRCQGAVRGDEPA